MTYRVYYYADQAFLSFVKRTIRQFDFYSREQKQDFEAEDSSVCIIACHSAIEAFLNTIGRDIVNDFTKFECMSIEDKIIELYKFSQNLPSWDKMPLQDIKKIVKVRNWLTHYKNPDIGLMNSMGQWVIDSYNKKPKIDDGFELKINTVKRYYDSTRKALYEIGVLFNIEQNHNYLLDENYSSYIIG